MVETAPVCRMNADQLDAYIALCLSRQSELGEHYVRRQIEWADAQLDRLLGEGANRV